MAEFSILIEYLTGYAVATDSSSRERPEWPTHPARVYMALAAAHFETDGPPEQKRVEREALEWLATLPAPDLVVPDHSVRDVLTTYVPVNDQKGGEALVKRSRQPRMFPRVYIGSAPVRLIWSCFAEAPPAYLDALETVCLRVTRIGHSSSLVWVRLDRSAGDDPPNLIRDEGGLDHRMRVVTTGALARLESAFNAEAIDAHGRLEAEIARSKGAAKTKLKQALGDQFPGGPPQSRRPVISLYQGYRAPAAEPRATVGSVFDPKFIVLRASDHSPLALGLESTARVVDALRRTILATFGDAPVPAWVSGHEPNGDRLQSGPHIAIAPLAFVGSQYADGHLMGLGIMIPKGVPLSDRGRALSRLLFDDTTGTPKAITLRLGRQGRWDLVRESSGSGKQTLQTGTYTVGSRSWASVTPIILDRMPRADRVKEPLEWREEVARILVKSCDNVGLPEPIAVRVEKTPFFRGSLRAMPGQGGFPQLRKGTFQVHAALEFEYEIEGPVLLGAGRFIGYGLLRPWEAPNQ